MIASIKKLFKDYFFAGLLVVGPLAICFFFLRAIVRGMDELLQTARWAPFNFPGFGILLSLVIILTAGFLARIYLGHYIFRKVSQLFERIPILGGIYKSLKQVFQTLFVDHDKHFSRVVLIPFPSAGHDTIAFVTSETIPAELQKHYSEPMLSVFVPNTPLPSAGFYLLVPVKETRSTDLTVEQAFKLVISLGLVTPEES